MLINEPIEWREAEFYLNAMRCYRDAWFDRLNNHRSVGQSQLIHSSDDSMAGKGKKKKDAGGNKDKKKGGKKKAGRTSGSGKSSKIQGDIFSDGAIENAYLLCHNVQVGIALLTLCTLWVVAVIHLIFIVALCYLQDVLKVRGFAWPDGKTKGKKKRK